MGSDGKSLEALVSFIEERMLPPGFSVTNNRREYGSDGVQLAEFDIVVSGRLGTTTISWLIECRDRPDSGAAPGAWIEQLAFRRQRFGFNKVTAVSTTGFSPSAVDCARKGDVELREVASLNSDEFREWLHIEAVTVVLYVHDLKRARFAPPPGTTQEDLVALSEALRNADGAGPILRGIKTGEVVKAGDAFTRACSSIPNLKEGLGPGSPPKKVRLRVRWQDDDYFVIATSRGDIRLFEALFDGEIRVQTESRPIFSTKKYLNFQTGETISEVVGFRVDLGPVPLDLEMHRIPEKGIFVMVKLIGTGNA